MKDPRIVAVCGSLRDESYTRTALEHVLAAAEDAGADTTLIDLGEWNVPMYDPDVDIEDAGDAKQLVDEIRAADGVVLGSPVYHGTFTGALKNFHDHCSYDEYEDTVVGLLTVAGGSSYASTLDHMRITVRGVHGWVLPQQVAFPGVYDKFEDDPCAVGGRRITDESLEERVVEFAETLVTHASARRTPEISATVGADD